MHLDPNSAQAGRGLVGANGENVPAKDGLPEDQGHENGQPNGNPDSGGKRQQIIGGGAGHDAIDR